MARDVLIFDIETDNIDVEKANLKYFGAFSYMTNKYYLIPYTEKEKINNIIEKHSVFVGFNNKEYDQPIIERFLDKDCFKYKSILDLFQISAPKGFYGKFNKNKLVQMGYKNLKNYKLKTIIESIKLDDSGTKGDIDYNIFMKDSWDEEEIKEIKKYLKQDILLTKKLYEWYEEQFAPLKEFLPEKDQKKLKHLTSSLSSLSYQIICNKAGLNVLWEDKKPENRKTFPGGHHIEPRWSLAKGNIVEIDFTSAYPHALMMGNLYSRKTQGDGWDGKDYFNIEGKYDKKEMGKIEKALYDIFKERLKAKRNGDKAKNLSYKVVINSLYGLTGNYVFKSLYDPIATADCTSIVRTWMKKLAKTLEEEGFTCLYGFTDSIFVSVPKESSEEELMMIVNDYIKEVKSKMPFPLDTFGMEVEDRLKMIWFVAKNCYLYVDINNEVKYRSTLLNKNTPKVVMDIFNDYMKPKIVSELDINFTKDELEHEIRKLLIKYPEKAGEEHNVGPKHSYKSKSCLQYQISEYYGEGKHNLIPNKASIGVGRGKDTKKRKAIKRCTVRDFNKNKLTVDDIDIDRLLKHLKPFYKFESTKSEAEKYCGKEFEEDNKIFFCGQLWKGHERKYCSDCKKGNI